VYVRHGHKHAEAENKMEEQLYNETNFNFESVSCVLNHAIITILAKAAVDIVKTIFPPYFLFNQFWNYAD
jgi:acid phosphatase family membrane protein YuiD